MMKRTTATTATETKRKPVNLRAVDPRQPVINRVYFGVGELLFLALLVPAVIVAVLVCLALFLMR